MEGERRERGQEHDLHNLPNRQRVLVTERVQCGGSSYPKALGTELCRAEGNYSALGRVTGGKTKAMTERANADQCVSPKNMKQELFPWLAGVHHVAGGW